ncbi:MAG: hypothetical protein WCJ45_07025 [bacterium]
MKTRIRRKKRRIKKVIRINEKGIHHKTIIKAVEIKIILVRNLERVQILK